MKVLIGHAAQTVTNSVTPGDFCSTLGQVTFCDKKNLLVSPFRHTVIKGKCLWTFLYGLDYLKHVPSKSLRSMAYKNFHVGDVTYKRTRKPLLEVAPTTSAQRTRQTTKIRHVVTHRNVHALTKNNILHRVTFEFDLG